MLLTPVKLNPIFKQENLIVRAVVFEQQSLILMDGSYLCVLFNVSSPSPRQLIEPVH